ncbi:gamma-glutamylcyclotransferase family protein [Profundibacter sp.]|uniref:gamma-glutamylcyclotransferase family protein n=1 Tax=Profundibacter sp. TaxID=3101071 RepID=UPI003D12A688
MKDPFFFGYGSLVNRKTHEYEQAHPAQITGWRRAWRRSPLRDLCYLTAVPDADCTIDGLIAAVPDGDWQALDIRERAYLRQDATHQVHHEVNHDPEVAIYAIEANAHQPPTTKNPILLSYLDVVVQGYFNEFGEEGVARFFDTTDGWHAPILDDRDAPIYPRAITPDKTEIVRVAWHLANLDV